ncbi:MAG: glycosyltransferase [Rikenellaceae bacterium]|nr:glycosyltransferase [Rikenellaceae bacterium]
MKSVSVVGPAHPYRGGLASIMEILARTFAARGCRVDIKTFTLQYPQFLFPGKSQYRDDPRPADLDITRCINTVNPFNWVKVGRRLRRERPDMVIMKYWTPFMAPCFGTIARIARGNGRTRVIVQIDNVVPHEHHFIDTPFTRYFLRSVDGFVYMSQQVKNDLDAFGSRKPALFSPHPLFVNFGEAVPREEACRHLNLDPALHYSLFFGLIRDYKGLDLLLDAWKLLREKGVTGDKRLIVAGEFYAGRERYLQQIERNGLCGEVILHDRFIPDEEVRHYFSASDVLIQPYRSATQSGVTQIAYNFNLPMIVTDVGGLAEIVPHDVVGYVTDTTARSVADAVERFYTGDNAERFRRNMVTERERFSWEAMADKLEEVWRQAGGTE